LYFITKEIFDEETALIAAFFGATSYFLVNFSRHLSNASPLPVTTALAFYGFYLWIKDKKWGMPIAVLGIGLSTQFNFYYIYLFIFFLIFKTLYNPEINKKGLCRGLIAGMLTFASFIVSEIKFNFLGVKELIGFIGHDINQHQAADAFTNFINKIVKVTGYNFMQFNLFLSLIVFIFMIYSLLRNSDKQEEKTDIEFLIIWFLSSLPLFGFITGVVESAMVVNSSVAYPVIILTAYFARKLLKQNKALFGLMMGIIIFSNLSLFMQSNWIASNLFFPGNRMLLENEKQVLSYMYEDADGEDFSFCGVTEPAFINSTWAYLFEWYGKNNYGYQPYWSGPDQDPKFSASEIEKEEEFLPNRYIIYEPNYGISNEIYQATRLLADRTTELVERKVFGDFVVEKRRILRGEEREQAEREYQQKVSGKIKKVIEGDFRYNCL
jgi:4-amino-4-deoxy-L-arabinose transferase-like glycosyltransferase